MTIDVDLEATTVDLGVDSATVALDTISTAVALDLVDGAVALAIGSTVIALEVGASVATLDTATTSVELEVAQTVVDLDIGLHGPPGETGPQGPAGVSDSITFTKFAAVDLSGHRIVTPQQAAAVAYASNTVAGDAVKPMWLTVNAAAAGDPVTVVAVGGVTEPSWAWIPDLPVYLGANGALTQSPPTVAAGALFLIQVGVAESATTVFIDPQPPIALTP